MMFSKSLTFAGLLALLAVTDTEARGLKKSTAATCPKSNKVPDSVKDALEMFSNPPASVAGKAVECKGRHTTKVVKWETLHPTGPCGSTFHFEEELDACCGGFVADNQRTITVTGKFKTPREINGVTFDIDLIDEPQNCCSACKCWGDPHCSSFDETSAKARSEIKSFVACETSKILDNGKCTNRLEVSDAAKDRCLGIDDNYKFNADKCEWKADNKKFNVKTDGSPCVPKVGENISMKLIGRTVGDAQVVQESVGVQSDWYIMAYDVDAVVGERGVIELVTITLTFKNRTNNNKREEKVKFNVKEDCFYPTNEDGDLIAPKGTQTSREAIFENDFLVMYRTTVVQTGPDGEVNAMDVFWEVIDKVFGDTFDLNCRGATDRRTRQSANLPTMRDMLEEEGDVGTESGTDLQNLYENIEGQNNGVGSYSTGDNTKSDATRIPKYVHFDTISYTSKISKGQSENRGFCFNSIFEEYLADDWYGASGSPYELVCGYRNNLDFADRRMIAELDDCQELLKSNNCNGFKDGEGIAYDKSVHDAFANYLTILDKCITAHCAAAYIPTGESRQTCLTEFYDYGSGLALNKFPPVKGSSVAEAEEDSSSPVEQKECESYVEVYYETEEGYSGTKKWKKNGKPINFPVSGTPAKVILTQYDCAGICGTRPRVEFDATFSTACSELPEDEYVCKKRTQKNECVTECFETCDDECDY